MYVCNICTSGLSEGVRQVARLLGNSVKSLFAHRLSCQIWGLARHVFQIHRAG